MWTRVGVLGEVSSAGVLADGAFRLGPQFVLASRLEVEGQWFDLDLGGTLGEGEEPFIMGSFAMRSTSADKPDGTVTSLFRASAATMRSMRR